MKSALTLLLFIITSNLYSQTQYMPGLIVTSHDDTILCQVPMSSSFGDVITIKKTEKGEEERLPLDSIKYLANGINVFENVSLIINGKNVHKLMWLKAEGAINLYIETVINKGDSRSLNGGTFTAYGPPTITYALRKVDTTYTIDEHNFVQIITPLISDNTDIVHILLKGYYSFTDLEALVRDYDNLPESDDFVSNTFSGLRFDLFTDKQYKKILGAECNENIYTKVPTSPSIAGGTTALVDSLSAYLKNHDVTPKGKATFAFLLTKNSNIVGLERISGDISKEKEFKKAILAYSAMWVPAMLQNSNKVCVIVRLEVFSQGGEIMLKILKVK